MELYFSIIIPVYNRPDEVGELLESLASQTDKNFEVILVEDGSTQRCDTVARQYADRVNIRYYFKENSGRSQTRNYGMARASGNYLPFSDSDCILPPFYFERLNTALTQHYVDCFGGPDKAHESFTALQKAISYSMTSFFTTGGIRGGKRGQEKFSPRTFNMGFSRQVYERVGGFKDMFGEDIDLSTRIRRAGFSISLIREVFVYHKRRVSFRSFFKQVRVFGMARLALYQLHPGSLKIVHLLPAAFVIGCALLLVASLFCPYAGLPILLWVGLLFVESLVKNKSIHIAFLSVIAGFIQLSGYGIGFIKAFTEKIILHKQIDTEQELNKHYKKTK